MARKNKIQFSVGVKDDASHALQRINKNVGTLGGSLKSLGAVVAGGFGISKIAQQADTYRLLQNRLKLVTSGTEELKAVTDELVRVSFDARTSFSSTADLYARVARSSRDLGLSQQELIDFTETVSKSITISGSTAQEAAAGVIQFGQALASSRLSGDELRSVLEQMPRLAQAIAEGMGVGIGQLREMGEAGTLSATKVLESLRKAAPAIAREFAQLQPLLSQGFTLLESATMIAIGNIDQFLGVSQTLAATLIDVANQVVILGVALTDDLSKEQIDEISTSTQVLAVSLLSVAFALGSIRDALSIAASPMDLVQNAVSRMVEIATTEGGEGGQYQDTDALLKGLRLALDDTIDETSQSWESSVDGMTDRMENFVIRIKAIFGEISESAKFDLSGVPEGETPEERHVRDARKSALNQLQKIRDSLVQQSQAMLMAADGSIEYADALQLVKIRAFAAASGNKQLGYDAESLAAGLKVLKDAASDSAVIEALEEELRLIRMTNEQRFVYLKLQELSTQASDKQIDQMIENAQELFRLMELLKNQTDFMEDTAEQAAKNMQNAFAEFFFDPFEDGLKGLLIGFLNVIRRMIAEVLAFQALEAMTKNDGGFWSTLIQGITATPAPATPATATPSVAPSYPTPGVPRFAGGGTTLGGQPMLVGERGPEIFTPSGAGRVTPNSAVGNSAAKGAQFITNIDARGADPGLIARLPAILEARDRNLMAIMQRYTETGVMPI